MSHILHNYKFYWNEDIIYIYYREFIYVKEESYFQNKYLIDRNKLEASRYWKRRMTVRSWCIIIYSSKRERDFFLFKNLRLQITIYNFFMMQSQSIIILEFKLICALKYLSKRYEKNTSSFVCLFN